MTTSPRCQPFAFPVRSLISIPSAGRSDDAPSCMSITVTLFSGPPSAENPVSDLSSTLAWTMPNDTTSATPGTPSIAPVTAGGRGDWLVPATM